MNNKSRIGIMIFVVGIAIVFIFAILSQKLKQPSDTLGAQKITPTIPQSMPTLDPSTATTTRVVMRFSDPNTGAITVRELSIEDAFILQQNITLKLVGDALENWMRTSYNPLIDNVNALKIEVEKLK